MPVPATSSCENGLEDIEDIFVANDLTPEERTNSRQHVNARVRRLNGQPSNGDVFDDERPLADSIIPGTQTIFVKTWGCTHNNSDSEYMAGQLAAFGYKITTST